MPLCVKEMAPGGRGLHSPVGILSSQKAPGGPRYCGEEECWGDTTGGSCLKHLSCSEEEVILFLGKKKKEWNMVPVCVQVRGQLCTLPGRLQTVGATATLGNLQLILPNPPDFQCWGLGSTNRTLHKERSVRGPCCSRGAVCHG